MIFYLTRGVNYKIYEFGVKGVDLMWKVFGVEKGSKI